MMRHARALLSHSSAAGLRRLASAALDRSTITLRAHLAETHDALFVDLSNTVGRSIWLRGVYEEAVTRTIMTYLRPGGTFVDVGANVGYFAVRACRSVGPTGAVHAIEANPRLVALLERSKHANGFDQLTIHPLAVADFRGVAELQVQRSSGVSFLGSRSSTRPGDKVVRVENVPVAPLDDVLSPALTAGLSVLKIDVEGRELDVLKGASQLLTHGPPIVIELVEANLARFSTSVAEVKAFLASYAYSPLKIEGAPYDWAFVRRA